MSIYVAQPMSRNNIRHLVNYIRNELGLSTEHFFPVVEFLEFGLPRMDDSFVLEIGSIKEMGGRYGVTYPEQSKIVLREDVYNNAVDGVPRDRFTIAHEIGHYIMHSPNRVAFARERKKEKLAPYLDPEWQANTFAGELLAPPKIIKGLSLIQITELCGVSSEVARIQSSKI
jgi:Zn-dependent peptidase ImmA (M78 family)